MSNDLEIIKKLEKQIGKKLERVELDWIIGGIDNGYTVDKNERVFGLNLYDCNLSNLSRIVQLKNLTNLYLGFNKLSDISGIEQLKNLTSLDLSYNKLSDISGIEQLTKLNVLYLEYNRISKFPDIKHLTN